MRRPRFYQPTALQLGEEIELHPAASRHAVQVLRLSSNDEITLFNGQGGEYTAVITHIKKNQATVVIKAFDTREAESTLKLHLAQGIARGEKMDFILQKAVELGVNKITPLFTDHSNVKLNAERTEQKMEHWRGVIISACEQSGRNHIPELMQPIVLKNWLPTCKETYKFILHPGSEQALLQQVSTVDSVCIMVGAEGGFSELELRLATQHQFVALQLGPRILRTETAGLAAIAIMQSKWGDLK